MRFTSNQIPYCAADPEWYSKSNQYPKFPIVGSVPPQDLSSNQTNVSIWYTIEIVMESDEVRGVGGRIFPTKSAQDEQKRKGVNTLFRKKTKIQSKQHLQWWIQCQMNFTYVVVPVTWVVRRRLALYMDVIPFCIPLASCKGRRAEKWTFNRTYGVWDEQSKKRVNDAWCIKPW